MKYYIKGLFSDWTEVNESKAKHYEKILRTTSPNVKEEDMQEYLDKHIKMVNE